MLQFQERLRRAAPEPFEARFAFFDHRFKLPSIKVLPGEYFTSGDEIAIQTVLGSCVAVCMFDESRRVGGMNHFLLPGNTGTSNERDQQENSRYGMYAMEVLINRLLKMGATRTRLVCKIFGGASVISGMSQTNVGKWNVDFIEEFLARERIPIRSRDVLDVYPRRVVFFPVSGEAMVKKLPPTASTRDIQLVEARARQAARPAPQAGSVELF